MFIQGQNITSTSLRVITLSVNLEIDSFEPPFSHHVNTICLFLSLLLYFSSYGVTLSSIYSCSTAYRTGFMLYDNKELHSMFVFYLTLPYPVLLPNN